MNKVIYSFFLVLGGLALISNSAGRGTASGNGAADAPGDGITCASAGCHGASNFGPQIRITLSQDGEEVSNYMPGETYKLDILVLAAQGAPSRYGFQMTAVVDSDNSSGAGEFVDIGSSSKELTLNGRSYLEHDGNINSPLFTTNWTAPAEGTGDITVYAAGIASNSNGNSGGDGGATSSMTFSESAPNSINEISEDEMSIYPNPATDYIYIDTELNTEAMTYEIRNLQGQIVLSSKVQNFSINIANLTKGLYIATIRDKNRVYTQKIYKEAF